MTTEKISIAIPFLSPIGTRVFSRLKKTATDPGALEFSEAFGKFFGEGYPHVRIKTEYNMGGA